MMNLYGRDVMKDVTQPTTAQIIRNSCATIQPQSPFLQIARAVGAVNLKSKHILNEVLDSISYCSDVNGNLIDRKIVQTELQTLAKEINNAVKVLEVFDFTDRWEKLRIPYFDVFNKIATEMVFKSIRYGEHTNEELVLNAAEYDKQSMLNQIPKELMEIIAMTMYAAKLNDAMVASKTI